MQPLSSSDDKPSVPRGRASVIWGGWVLLTLLDLLFDLPGPIGFMCTLILANEWMRTLPGIPAFSLVVLSSSLAAGVIHQSDSETWWTRMVVVGIAAAVFLTMLHPKLRSMVSGDDLDEASGGNQSPHTPRPLTDHGTSFANLSRLGDLVDHGDISGPTQVMPHVPIKVRLIDSGVFPLDVASQIATVVDDAPSLEVGCRRCVSRDLLTAFQAEYIKQGFERKLRVGRYTLVDKLGEGAMGVVYRAFDRERSEQVALKLFRDRRSNLMLIRREMAVISELAHPHIVTALDVGESDRQHFIAMEIVEGETLQELVRRDGPLEEPVALHFTMQIAQALAQAHHRNILHRDIKPGNVMLTPEGICKLMDLGLSRPPENLKEYDSICISTSSIYGTIGFVAPEQAGLTEDVDTRADIFGLGSTLFYLLTGKSYVRGDSAAEKLKNLTVHRSFRDFEDFTVRVGDLLKGMLAYRPEDRYQSIETLIDDLGELLDDHGQGFDETMVPVLVIERGKGLQSMSEQLIARGNRSLDISRVESIAAAEEVISRHQATSTCPMVVLVDLGTLDEKLVQLFDIVSDRVGVVVLTHDDSPKTRKLCLSAGVAGYVLMQEDSGRALEQEIFAARSRIAYSTSQSNVISETEDSHIEC